MRAAAHRIVLAYLTRLGLGRLPDDLVVERKRLNIHVPLMTSMLISTAVTFVLSAAL